MCTACLYWEGGACPCLSLLENRSHAFYSTLLSTSLPPFFSYFFPWLSQYVRYNTTGGVSSACLEGRTCIPVIRLWLFCIYH